MSKRPLCPAMLGASRSGGKLSAPQRKLRNLRGPVQIADAGPLISNGGRSQGGHSRAEPRARPAQDSGGTARGVSGGTWHQECEQDRRAREGGGGGSAWSLGAPSEGCAKREAGGTAWGA